MSRYRFLGTRRWVGVALIAVVVATTCVFLGIWQWHRHEQRAAANELVNTNYDRAPEPMGELVDDSVPADLVWRRVEVSGRYVGEQVVVRNRPVDGTAAARVLALLRTDGTEDDDGGRLVVVDRGWVPLGESDPVLPDYPDGAVSVVGRLRQAEAADSRTAPAGQVYAIDPATVATATGADGTSMFDGYLLAVTEDGAAPAGLQAFPRPETSPGSHLSYAFQWWVFAGGALVGYVVLARREAAETWGPPTAPPGGAVARGGRAPDAEVKGRQRRRSDAEEEDALIDAQLHET